MLLSHFIENGSIPDIVLWFKYGVKTFIFSYAVMLLLILFLSAIFNSVFIGSFSVLIFSILMSFVSYMKYFATGSMLVLSDFSFVASLADVASVVDFSIYFDVFVILRILMIALILIYIWIKRIKTKFYIKVRIGIIIIVPLILFFGLFSCMSYKYFLISFGNVENENISHITKGIFASLYLEHANNKIEEYELENLYSRENIFSILDEIKRSALTVEE